MTKQYTRKQFIDTSLKAVFGGAAAMELGFAKYLFGSTGPHTMEDVRSGMISPEKYLEEKENSLPGAAKAKQDGPLRGIVYEPTEQELAEMMTEIYTKKGLSDQQVKSMTGYEVGQYGEIKMRNPICIMRPGAVPSFGTRTPVYLCVTENLFSDDMVSGDGDADSILGIHEMKHAMDWYFGIMLGMTHLSHDSVKPGRLKLEFFNNLAELRAVYDELEDAFRNRVFYGKNSISENWLKSQGQNYNRHWTHIDQNAETDLEKRVRKLQFGESRAIRPEKHGDMFAIRFNLFGRNDVLQFSKE
ncbi:MAG: hypothetical protein JW754_02170 [Candidatus Aenigmarchaeota archaeon]|nr:hypothetical protein [Candidatus Aenigmarchaeota archaeon]